MKIIGITGLTIACDLVCRIMNYTSQQLTDQKMKLIALDIETTGVSPLRGDRIVEIGDVEVVDGKLYTKEKNVFHQYINPERHIPEVVVRIHGIDDTKVKDKPVFKDIFPWRVI